MTTKRVIDSTTRSPAVLRDDYRASHLERGGAYDATLRANPFDAYMAKWEAYWLLKFLRRVYPDRIPHYLDFACGTGRITELVAPLARESIGVDVSASMLETARAKCEETRFIEADLTRAEVTLGQFDVVTSFRFLGNAQDQLRRDALSVMARLLRPGGHLIINNHRNPKSISALLHRATGGVHGMDLTYGSLRRLLCERGLRVVEARPIGFWLLRSRMQLKDEIRESGERLERAFASRLLVPFAPDMFIVARKDRG
jgi:SAM-dependent methyltransferase